MDIEVIRKRLGVIPDFPKPGIKFLDIFPVLRDPILFETLITHLLHHITSHIIPRLEGGRIDVIVGLDARGFLLGPPLALRLGAAFVPVRKKGKLPGSTIQVAYQKEYGEDFFEIQADSIQAGNTVLIVDDLIATGGSAYAAGQLVEKLGGKTVEYIFIIGLPFLKGRDKLDAPSYIMIEDTD